jgi:prolyl 4-hydroxylase
MREHPINQQNNFIMGWYADDLSFVDELINFHNNSDDKTNGTFPSHVKESTDSTIFLHNETTYWKHLNQCWVEYSKKYPGAFHNCGLKMLQGALIQHYPIGGGFKAWHAERGEDTQPNVSRHLVFMTYLNDVPDGGTEFMYQDLKVTAEKGLTIIWPADWTFTHRGEVSHTMEKWIITGWVNLKDKNENSNLQRPTP